MLARSRRAGRSGDRSSLRPGPPEEGFGPAVAWRRESARRKAEYVILMLGLLAAATAGISALHGIGVAALGAWQTWAILLATTWLSVRPMDVEVASVGVDWLQFGRPRRWYRRREARRGVLLYQLITVRVHLAGEEPRLTVSDSHGNSVECDLMDAQSDRRGWDLVYNGIVHSVAAGAVITPTTADVLGLRDHPALDLSDVPPSAPGIRGANPARNDRDRI